MDLSDVRIVFGPDELARIGRFRYQVYIEEQGKNAHAVDHAARSLIEPIDRAAATTIFYLEREGELVATLRAEFLDEGNCDHADAFAAFDFMPPSQMISFTRLMVAPRFRRSDATPKLLFLGFALALLKDRCLGLLTCKPELVPVFEMYGCLQYADAFVHAESGPQVPMAILGELDYLRTRAAPLADWLAPHRPQSLYTDRFLAPITAYRIARSRPVRAATRLTA